MRIETILLFLFSFLMILPGFAQDRKESKQLGILLNRHGGFIMQHRKNLEHIVRGHVTGTELSFEIQTTGKKPWEETYGKPQWGVSLEHYFLGNTRQLGEAYGAYPYLKLYLVEKEHWALKTRLGWGIGYLTQVWDNERNFKNNLISSSLNICASIGTEFNVRIASAWALNSGVRFTHYSNGALKYPNLGVNIVSLYAGVAYHFKHQDKKEEILTEQTESRDWRVNLLFTGFRKGQSAGVDKRYNVLNVNLGLQRQVNQKLFFQVGGDFFYDSWMEYYYLKEHIAFSPDKDYIILGGYGAAGLRFGKLSGMMAMGVYLHGKELPNGNMYNRLTTQYDFTNRFFGSFSIKAHHFKADYFELGVGCTLWKK